MRSLLVGLLCLIALAVPAQAFRTTTEAVGATYSISTSTTTSYSGAFINTSYCDRLFYGVFVKSTNGARAVALYADSASVATTTQYQRSAALGNVGGQSAWYMREATTAANMPVSRFTLSYSSGFTGTVGAYCTHDSE